MGLLCVDCPKSVLSYPHIFYGASHQRPFAFITVSATAEYNNKFALEQGLKTYNACSNALGVWCEVHNNFERLFVSTFPPDEPRTVLVQGESPFGAGSSLP